MGDEGKLLLIRGRRTKALLGLAALAVLGLGAVAGPGATDPAIAVPAEPVAPLLAPEVENASAFRGVRAVGEATARHTVGVTLATPSEDDRHGRRSEDDTPAADRAPAILPGTVIGPSRVLTHGLAFADQALRAGATVTDAAGRTRAARVERCDPASGLVVLSVGESDGLGTGPALAAPVAWTAAVSVARTGGTPAVSPVWVASVEAGDVRLDLGHPAPGTGIFDDDARLVAVAGPDGSGWTAAAALERVDGLRVGVPVRLGLTLQPITDDLRPLVSAAGVLVADVVPDGPAARAGIVPGDVITRVASSPVARPRDLMVALALLSPGAEILLYVTRSAGERELAARVEAVCSPRVVMAPGGGRTADELFTAAALQAAGLDAAARVLEVNGGRPVPSGRARRSRPVLVRAIVGDGPAAFYAVVP